MRLQPLVFGPTAVLEAIESMKFDEHHPSSTCFRCLSGGDVRVQDTTLANRTPFPYDVRGSSLASEFLP